MWRLMQPPDGSDPWPAHEPDDPNDGCTKLVAEFRSITLAAEVGFGLCTKFVLVPFEEQEEKR